MSHITAATQKLNLYKPTNERKQKLRFHVRKIAIVISISISSPTKEKKKEERINGHCGKLNSNRRKIDMSINAKDEKNLQMYKKNEQQINMTEFINKI